MYKQKSANDRSQHGSLTTLYAEKKYPMIVTGNAYAALGAAMALCTRDVLRNSSNNDNDSNSNDDKEIKEERPPLPPAQLIALCNYPGRKASEGPPSSPSSLDTALQNALLFGQFDSPGPSPKVNDYETILSSMNEFLSCIYSDKNDYGKPIFHTKFGNKGDLKLAGTAEVLSNASIRKSMSYLGLHLNMDLIKSDENAVKCILPKEDATEWGTKLQTVLNDGSSSPIPAAVTMDTSSHLAFLQANSLAKCRGVLGNHDIWAIEDDIRDGLSVDSGDCMLFEYQYDYNNPMGGSDPLLCPSKGYTIDSASLSSTSGSNHDGSNDNKANDAYAAAYSALRGSGMDPIPSLCIATSVKAIFRTFDNDLLVEQEGNVNNLSYSWDVIEKIADYSRLARLNAFEEDGLPRKKYREFGYK